MFIQNHILDNRLKPVIGETISDTQTGFIQDRFIFDGVLSSHESIPWLKKKRKATALFKIGFRKTYDSLRWCFVEHMLKQVGLGPRMINWILSSVRTASISIMVNGYPTQPFNM